MNAQVVEMLVGRIAEDARRAKSLERKLEEIGSTYVAKNTDYGSSFFETLADYGMSAGVARLGDKMNRLKTLVLREEVAKVKDESMIDTLTDLACYAIMMAVYLEEEKD